VERNFWTGIDVRPVDVQIARYFGLKQAQGVIVSDIQKNSPADRAGLLIADIIVEINGERIITNDNLISIMQESRAGDKWKIKVYRDKKIVTIDLTLEKQN
jgi:serine protease Do